MRGRGTGLNPPNRFERMHVEPAAEDEWREEPEPGSVPTEYFRAANRTILTSNDSPDVGFSTTINPYNGCSHGCIYCYANRSFKRSAENFRRHNPDSPSLV